jgi:O-antigen ligase
VNEKFQEEIKQFKNALQTIKSTRDFLGFIPSSSLHKIAFWLLTAFIASPFYVLLRSIFLKDHVDFFINTNLRDLGTYWLQFIQVVGFSGLFLTLLFLVKAITQHKQKGWLIKTVRKHPVPLFLFLLLVWSVFSYVFSSNHTLSLYGSSYRHEGIITYFAYAGIFCCGYLVTEPKFRVNLMKVFVFTATALSILILINNAALNQLFSLKYNSAIFQNINHCGYYLCLAAMLAAALVLREIRLSRAAIFWALSFAIIIAALIKNNSFGPYVAVVLGLGFLLIFTLKFVHNARRCAFLLVLVFIFLSVGFNLKSNYLNQEAVKLTEDIVNIVENNEKAPQAGSNRWILWVRGIEYTMEKPIFGYGPDNLSDRYQMDDLNHDRPHNEILQLSASLGIPAALFYGCALLFFFLPLLKNLKKLNAEILGPYAAIFAYLASSMVGLSMFYTAPFYFAFLGLTCNLFRPAGNEPAVANE